MRQCDEPQARFSSFRMPGNPLSPTPLLSSSPAWPIQKWELRAESCYLHLRMAPLQTVWGSIGSWRRPSVSSSRPSGSVVGVTGAIYAIRKELYAEIPAGTILDDVFVPMRVVKAGKRVVFQPSAIARDTLFSQKGKEFSRKVRTLTGNYQLLSLEPWLLSPRNPLLFRFISHKLLRLLVPLFLALMLVAFRDSERRLLSLGIPFTDLVLRCGCIRSHETIDKGFQTDRNRSHIRNAQYGCCPCVLHLRGRRKESVGLVP